MRVSVDEHGAFYANNVRVNGIIPRGSSWFLAGILNAPATDMLFKWIGKPKDNDYYEANRQFIAPLPIPHAGEADHAEVARIAEALQRGYTERNRLRRGLAERLGTLARRRRSHEWLLPEVESKQRIEAAASPRMLPTARRELADTLQAEQIEAAVARIDEALRLDSVLDARFEDGELMLLIDGAPALRGVYADAEQGAFWLAQWQAIALAFEPNGRDNGKRLIDGLRTVADEAAPAIRAQIIDRQQALSTVAVALRDEEAALHAITVRLFALTPAERALVGAR